MCTYYNYFRKMIPFLMLVICISVSFGGETIKYAAVIYRHGDRTPVDPYPNDPWKNESLWPVKFGELTNTGKMQHYEFGRWLRNRYSHLLSKEFDPTEIYVRSTDVDRTLMSAQVNLAGLYPPTDGDIWNQNLKWQPVPVHTIPETDDELLAMKKECPVYNMEYDKYIKSKPYLDRLNTYQPLMKYLSKNTGKKIKTYYDIDDIYSTLYIESLYNFTLPEWTKSVYPDKLREPACYSFRVATATPLLARLKVGPLMKYIKRHLVDAVKGVPNYRKVQIYSGHDLTVGSVLNALGMYNGQCPCYASAVFVELLIDDAKKHYVRISYKNKTVAENPIELEIPQCGIMCPVDKFVKLYANLIQVNWDRECNAQQFPPLLGTSFIVGLCLFISIYIGHKIHFSRVYRQNRENGHASVPVLTSDKRGTNV